MIHRCSVVVTSGMRPGEKYRATATTPVSGNSLDVIVQVPHNAEEGDELMLALHEQGDLSIVTGIEAVCLVNAAYTHQLEQQGDDDMQVYKFKVLPQMSGKLLLCKNLPGCSKKVVVQVPEATEGFDTVSFALPIDDPVTAVVRSIKPMPVAQSDPASPPRTPTVTVLDTTLKKGGDSDSDSMTVPRDDTSPCSVTARLPPRMSQATPMSPITEFHWPVIVKKLPSAFHDQTTEISVTPSTQQVVPCTPYDAARMFLSKELSAISNTERVDAPSSAEYDERVSRAQLLWV